MAQHTPGPWGVERRQATGYGASSAPYEIWARGAQSFTIALLNGRESPEIEANARLIAAAPTMRDYIERRSKAGDAEAAHILEAIDGCR